MLAERRELRIKVLRNRLREARRAKKDGRDGESPKKLLGAIRIATAQ